MPPAVARRLAVDEALDQIPRSLAALDAHSRFFAQVRLGSLSGEDVDGIDRKPRKREAGRLSDGQLRCLVHAGVPDREQRDPVGPDEIVEADPLVHAPRGELAQEAEVLAADRHALASVLVNSSTVAAAPAGRSLISSGAASP